MQDCRESGLANDKIDKIKDGATRGEYEKSIKQREKNAKLTVRGRRWGSAKAAGSASAARGSNALAKLLGLVSTSFRTFT